MANYFSVPHLGAGSLEVEGISSYLVRMARAHGCSHWQLARHLDVWWDRNNCNQRVGRLPRITQSGVRIQLCGVGSDTAKLVTALGAATGITSLRSATILSLKQVISSTSIGALKSSRAWCPACYAEDARERGEVYDRLLWALLPITRCSIHKTPLLQRCPSCESTQVYASGAQLDECYVCRANLRAIPPLHAPLEHPGFGEQLLHELVTACAENPNLTLNREGMRLFFKRHRRDLPPGDPLVNVRALGSRSSKPSLMSVLKFATAFGASLLDFQSSRPPDVTHCLYDAASIPSSRRSGRHSRSVYLKVQAALKAALDNPKSSPAFRTFCANQNVSTGYVRHNFSIEARRYADLRREYSQWRRESVTVAALEMANSGLIDDYRSGRIKQLKELIRAVANASGVQTLTARKVVEHCLSSDTAGQASVKDATGAGK